MDETIKKLWVKALKSNTYKQGKGHLRKDDSFCCLGVLCDLHSKSNPDSYWVSPTLSTSTVYKYSAGSSVDSNNKPTTVEDSEQLPSAVCDWAGINNNDIPILYEGDVIPIYSLNDGDLTVGIPSLPFVEIADIIETQL